MHNLAGSIQTLEPGVLLAQIHFGRVAEVSWKRLERPIPHPGNPHALVNPFLRHMEGMGQLLAEPAYQGQQFHRTAPAPSVTSNPTTSNWSQEDNFSRGPAPNILPFSYLRPVTLNPRPHPTGMVPAPISGSHEEPCPNTAILRALRKSHDRLQMKIQLKEGGRTVTATTTSKESKEVKKKYDKKRPSLTNNDRCAPYDPEKAGYDSDETDDDDVNEIQIYEDEGRAEQVGAT
jgi:hypothetical protein